MEWWSLLVGLMVGGFFFGALGLWLYDSVSTIKAEQRRIERQYQRELEERVFGHDAD